MIQKRRATRGRSTSCTTSPASRSSRCEGEHDLSTRELLAGALQQAAAHSDVLVDLSPCTFMDSTVINVLISTAHDVQAAGERLALVIPPEQRRVARVAEMTGLDKLLAVYETRDAALAALRPSA